MTKFNEFRVNLDPDIQASGNWNVTLVDCPMNVFVGPQGTVQGIVTHQQLLRLRSQHSWPNLEELKAIGQSVWESLMNPELKAAFFACLNLSENAGRGMRLVVSVPNSKLLEEDNPHHATDFGYEEARAAFAGFPRLSMLPQYLAELT